MAGHELETALDEASRLEKRLLNPAITRNALQPLSGIEHFMGIIESKKSKNPGEPFLPLSATGCGLEALSSFLFDGVVPALSNSSLSPHYYGFVTGGITPAARLAERIVSLYDQNVHVHLPKETVATFIEKQALEWLLEMLDLNGNDGEKMPRFSGTFTTGATAGNIMGLACAREWLLHSKIKANHPEWQEMPTSELGVLEASRLADIVQFKVLSTGSHSSLGKAASIIGLGRRQVKDLRTDITTQLDIDFEVLENELKADKTGFIVAVSCGEVNTGGFSTHGIEAMQRLRKLCDHYNAWLHVDGAFGIFASLLKDSGPDFATVVSGAEGMFLADSIAGDGHKMLNVPYDCGFFFCRHDDIMKSVFSNTNAAYLNAADASVPSPLNITLENSRRFRSLPVFASVLAYGKDWYRKMVEKQVRLARILAEEIEKTDGLELLPKDRKKEDIFNVVLFRATDNGLNSTLTDKIQAKRIIYVSETKWQGKPACRIAIANWQAEESHNGVVMDVLREVIRDFEKKM